MINLHSERSFIGALISPGVGHISAIQSISFESSETLIDACGAFFSVPLDFLIKVAGKQNLYDSEVSRLPFVRLGNDALERVLRLSCLASEYAEI